MRGIPRALGCIAYLSVWREVGALCVERLAVFVPSLPTLCFPLCISVTGACSSRGRGGSWLGCQVCQPLVQSPSWSWLPIVEAPGCFGHPTSKERRCCLFRGLVSLECFSFCNLLLLNNLESNTAVVNRKNNIYISPRTVSHARFFEDMLNVFCKLSLTSNPIFQSI